MPSIRTALYALAKALADAADRDPRLAEGIRRALVIDDNDCMTRRRSKLTPEQIGEARRRFNRGETLRALTRSYHVSINTLSQCLPEEPA